MDQRDQNEPVPSHIRLIQMATAIWPSRIIYLAAKLGLADHLKHGPKTLIEIAEATGKPASALRPLMDGLRLIGILSNPGPDYYRLTSVGKALQTGAPGSARAIVLLMSRDRLAGRRAVKESQAVAAGNLNGTNGTNGAKPREDAPDQTSIQLDDASKGHTERILRPRSAMAGSMGLRARRSQ